LPEDAEGKAGNEIAKKQMEMIEKFYGKDGLTIYLGVAGKRVLAVMGSDPGILEASVGAALADGKDLENNAMIAASKEQVVSNPVAVAYVSAGRWINAIQNMMLPNGVPGGGGGGGGGGSPMVMSAGVNGSTLTMEMHVPTTTITTVKDAWQKMMGLMMGGGGGGAQP